MDTSTCPTCSHALSPSDLPLHAILCPQFSAPPPRPPTPSILGLLFPSHPTATTPSPVWVPLSTTTDDVTSITFQTADPSPVFPPSSSPEPLYSDRNTRRNRDNRSMLEIWTLPLTESAGDTNGTITALSGVAGTGNGPFRQWTGPVLALAMTRATGLAVDPGMYRDVTVEDAVDAADFLLDYGDPERGLRVREALDMLGAEREGPEQGEEGVVGEGGGGNGNGKGKSGDEEMLDGEEKKDAVFEVM